MSIARNYPIANLTARQMLYLLGYANSVRPRERACASLVFRARVSEKEPVRCVPCQKARRSKNHGV